LPSDDAIATFMAETRIVEWNGEQDAGRSWDEAVAEHSAKFPQYATLIEAWHVRWEETMAGPIARTVDILRELRDAGIPLYALTNWSQEKFPIARKRLDFLDWFDGIVVSGEERLIKPDPRIYQVLFDRYGVEPADAVFIDDNTANVAAAAELGMTGLHFTSPDQLRTDLTSVGLGFL
jgi:2-haloacid dehalogenase